MKQKRKKRLTIDSVWRVFSPFMKEVISSVHGNKCVTGRIHHKCPNVELEGANRQLGHFKPKRAYPNVRWWIMNLNLQCAYCNGFLEGSEAEHAEYIRRTHGEQALKDLLKVAYSRNKTTGQYEYKIILEKINLYKKQIKNKSITYPEIYQDIVNTKFGLEF